MNLEFTKQGNQFVAEFNAPGTFNIHVEREGTSSFTIEVRTSETGKFAAVKGSSEYAFDKVIDMDVPGYVFPKRIRLSCGEKPTLAIITSASVQ